MEDFCTADHNYWIQSENQIIDAGFDDDKGYNYTLGKKAKWYGWRGRIQKRSLTLVKRVLVRKPHRVERRGKAKGMGKGMESDLATIRLIEDRCTVIEQPFTVIQFDDVMDERFFNDLNQGFPAPSVAWYEGRGLDSKYFLDSDAPTFETLARSTEAWNTFTDAVTDPAFWAKIGDLIQPVMARHKHAGLLAPQLPRSVVEAIDDRERFLDLLREKTRPYYQFSYLRAGDLNSPHSDNWIKLVSMIIYFPPAEWRAEFGGSTVFLRAKSDLASRPWYSPTLNRVPVEDSKAFFADMEPFRRTPYQGNSCVLFCKTINSFHAIEPIKCPPPMARRAFVIGLKLVDA